MRKGQLWEKENKDLVLLPAENTCQMKRLPESELLEAAESLLGENIRARVSADIDRVVVSDTQVDFEYKDGTVKTWQRK